MSAATRMTQEELAAFFRYLVVECGYSDISLIPGERYTCIARMGFTHAIIVGPVGNRYGFDDRWCYHHYGSAKAAIDAWDGEGEPKGWFRQPGTGRRISQSPDEYDDNGQRVCAVGVEYVRR